MISEALVAPLGMGLESVRVEERKSEPPGGGGIELATSSAEAKVLRRKVARLSSWGISSHSMGARALKASWSLDIVIVVPEAVRIGVSDYQMVHMASSGSPRNPIYGRGRYMELAESAVLIYPDPVSNGEDDSRIACSCLGISLNCEAWNMAFALGSWHGYGIPMNRDDVTFLNTVIPNLQSRHGFRLPASSFSVSEPS
jgi:hypothetical protein